MWYQFSKKDIEKAARQLYEIGIPDEPRDFSSTNANEVLLENGRVKIAFEMMCWKNCKLDPDPNTEVWLVADAYIDGIQIPCDLSDGPIWSRTPEAGEEEHRIGTLAYYRANIKQVLEEFAYSYGDYAEPDEALEFCRLVLR